jgi:hypothetical protein
MPAQAALTLNTFVYAPRGTQNGISSWQYSGATFGGGISILTESVRGPNSNGVTRARFLLTVPKLATTDTACGCIGSDIGKGKADVTIDLPTSFTLAERQDLCDRLQALVANAIFDSAVANLEGSWS